MSFSKKIRFEVFKRDGFKCAYCGKEPPTVVLEIDHIEPKASGGNNTLDNLITACFDCNRGKKDIPLSKIPGTIAENIEIIKEREEQLKEYRKLIKSIERRKLKEIDSCRELFESYFEKSTFTQHFEDTTLRLFLSKIPHHQVLHALRSACIKRIDDPQSSIKYFCGICWSIIKGTAKYK
jgi:CRISPR/Cas system Type II protein with McrA/HNH and RuvC-like nuclease domain